MAEVSTRYLRNRPFFPVVGELYARYVMPHFSRLNESRAASYQWCGDNRDEFSAKRNAAAKAMFDKHEAEQRTVTARPIRGREAW